MPDLLLAGVWIRRLAPPDQFFDSRFGIHPQQNLAELCVTQEANRK
jgi:hypothetical protein